MLLLGIFKNEVVWVGWEIKFLILMYFIRGLN